MLLDRDPAHWGAHFTEDAQSELPSGLAGALRTQHHLEQHRISASACYTDDLLEQTDDMKMV